MKRSIPMLAAAALLLATSISNAQVQDDSGQLPVPRPLPEASRGAESATPAPKVEQGPVYSSENMTAIDASTATLPVEGAAVPAACGRRGCDVRFPCARRLLTWVTYQPVEPGWHNSGLGCHGNGFPRLYLFFLCDRCGWYGCGGNYGAVAGGCSGGCAGGCSGGCNGGACGCGGCGGGCNHGCSGS